MAISIKRGDRGARVKVVQRLLHLYQDGIFGPQTEEAVKEFQRKKGLTADGIVGVNTWTRLLGYVLRSSRRNITEIIVHCTATPEGRSYTVADIRRWHLQRGFADIGYHYVVYLDGTIHEGRDINVAGAHCTGHNLRSIGVCYVGGVAADGKTPKDTRTLEQRDGLMALLVYLRQLYPQARIYGHRDFAAKACPSFDATREYRGL